MQKWQVLKLQQRQVLKLQQRQTLQLKLHLWQVSNCSSALAGSQAAAVAGKKHLTAYTRGCPAAVASSQTASLSKGRANMQQQQQQQQQQSKLYTRGAELCNLSRVKNIVFMGGDGKNHECSGEGHQWFLE
jgi:hypothetical protein